MNILNLSSCTLRTRAYVNATDAQQSTWLNLSMYCVTQENGGKIPAASSWSDMEWLLATGKHKAHVDASCGLWRFENGDCVVEFYPLEQEEKHKAKRAGGVEGNRRKYAKKSAPLASDSDTDSDSDSDSEPVGALDTDSDSSSVKEGKGKEGKGMEVNGSSTLTSASDDANNSNEPVVLTVVEDSAVAGEDSKVGEFAEWPTREEWLAACDMEALPRELAMREWNNQESKTPSQRWRKGSGSIDRSRLRYHAAYVKDFARQRGELGTAEKKFRPPASGSSGSDSAATMAAMAAMSANLNNACEYPAALKEAVQP